MSSTIPQGDWIMDYEPIKARYLRMYRLMDLNDFMGGIFCYKSKDPDDQAELDRLLDELGVDCADLDAWDAISDQLCGCQDIAPEHIRREHNLDQHMSATYHDVWREWITSKLLNCPESGTYAMDLYRAYARDVAITNPGEPASKLGFRDWMEAQ